MTMHSHCCQRVWHGHSPLTSLPHVRQHLLRRPGLRDRRDGAVRGDWRERPLLQNFEHGQVGEVQGYMNAICLPLWIRLRDQLRRQVALPGTVFVCSTRSFGVHHERLWGLYAGLHAHYTALFERFIGVQRPWVPKVHRHQTTGVEDLAISRSNGRNLAYSNKADAPF
jgi:hypothetical protein